MFIGTAIVVVLIITLVNGVLVRGFIAGASAVFQPQNASTRPGVEQPTQPERSGSPDSFAPWDTLGFQGRNFVATGPHADELTELNGRPAKEPIRIYAGLQIGRHHGRPGGGAAVGTAAHQGLRAQGAGDHSDHRYRVGRSGRRAIDRVDVQRRYRVGGACSIRICRAGFRSLPTGRSRGGRQGDDRRHPRAVAAAGPKTPTQAGALRREPGVDGRARARSAICPTSVNMGFSSVLWVGPPNASPLWKALTVQARPGSPEVQPRYDDGRTVRFAQASGPDEIAAVAAPPWQRHAGAVPAARLRPGRVVVRRTCSSSGRTG